MEGIKILSMPKTPNPGSTESEDSLGINIISRPNEIAQQEGNSSSIARTAVGVPLRIAESALGSVGDIRNAIKGLINHVTGGRSQAYRNTMTSEGGIPNPPTSEELRERTRQSPYAHLTEPKGYIEEVIHEVASDIGSFIPSMLIAGGGKLPFEKVGTRLRQFATGSALGSAGKGLAKYFGLDEGWQSLIKIGGQIGYNALGAKGAIKQAKDKLYDEVREGIKEDATHNSRILHKDSQKLYDSIKKGASPDKSKILDVLESAIKKTESGAANVREIWDLQKDINEHLGNGNLSTRSKGALKHLLGQSYEFLKDYDLNAYKKLQRANAIEKGFKDVSSLGKYLNKHADLENVAKNPLTKTVVWGNLLKGRPGAFAKGAATAAGLSLARGAEELRNILSKSSDAWATLGYITKAALEDNTPNFIKGIHRLDRIFDNQEKSRP